LSDVVAFDHVGFLEFPGNAGAYLGIGTWPSRPGCGGRGQFEQFDQPREKPGGSLPFLLTGPRCG